MQPRGWLWALAATSLVSGAMLAVLPPAPGQHFSGVDVVSLCVQAFLLFGWCAADADARGIRPPFAAKTLVAVFAIVGVPYYFFRTRPWRQAGVATLKALAFFIGITLLGSLSEYVGALILMR